MSKSWELQAREFADAIYPYIKRRIARKEFYEDFEDVIWNAVYDYKKAHKHNKLRVEAGATRVCIIGREYVLKFDFGDNIKNFGGCASELEMYKKAKRDGYSHLFAKCFKFVLHGYTFFAMEKIDHVGNVYKNDWTEDEKKYIRKNVMDMHSYNYGSKDDHVVIIDYAYNHNWADTGSL